MKKLMRALGSIIALSIVVGIVTLTSLTTTASPIVWTNQPVTATVTAHDVASAGGSPSDVLYYSKDGINWQESNQLVYTVAKGNPTIGATTIYVKDDVGNITSYNVTIDNIDVNEPTGNITKSIDEPTNTDIVLTCNANDDQSGVKEYSFDNGSSWYNNNTLNISENGNYTCLIKDNANNIGSCSLVVNNIDKIPPEITKHDIDRNWSGTTVEVGFDATDNSGDTLKYKISTNGGLTASDINDSSSICNVGDNGTYYLYARDMAGNLTVESVVIDNIDKTLPNASLRMSDNFNEDVTNEDITATVIASDNESGLAYNAYSKDGINYVNSNVISFDKNGSYTIYVKDKVGNVKTCPLVINNIDKSIPNVNVVVDNSTVCSELQISINISDISDSIDNVSSGIKSYKINDREPVMYRENIIATTSYDTMYSNGVYTVVVTDMAGNTNSYTFTVKCIDRETPNITVLTSCNGWKKTLDAVRVKFTDDNGIKSFVIKDSNNNIMSTTDISEDTKYEKVVEKVVEFIPSTDTYNLSVEDFKETDYTILNKVAYSEELEIKLDNVAPTINAMILNSEKTNSSVDIKILASDLVGELDYILLPNGEKRVSNELVYSVDSNGEYKFTAVDKAENMTTTTVNIGNIDKVGPNLTYSLDNEVGKWYNEFITLSVNATDDNGLCTINVAKDGVAVVAENNKYKLEENGEYTVSAVDESGNVTRETVVVDCIDKEAPIIEARVKNHYWEDNRNTIVIYTTDASGAVAYSLDGETWSEFNEFDVNYRHKYMVYVKDRANNIGQVEVSFNLIVKESNATQEIVSMQVNEVATEEETNTEPEVITEEPKVVNKDKVKEETKTIENDINNSSEITIFNLPVAKIAKIVKEITIVALPILVVVLIIGLGITMMLGKKNAKLYYVNKKNKVKYIGRVKYNVNLGKVSVTIGVNLINENDKQYLLKFSRFMAKGAKNAEVSINIGNMNIKEPMNKKIKFTIE